MVNAPPTLPAVISKVKSSTAVLSSDTVSAAPTRVPTGLFSRTLRAASDSTGGSFTFVTLTVMVVDTDSPAGSCTVAVSV